MLAKTSEGVSELSRAARLAELRERDRRTADILEWLAPVSWLHKHRDLQVKLAQGTGKSFLQHPDFTSWHEHTSSHDLLCIGGPGVGKSMLCALVVDQLRAKFKTKDVIVAYYYYDYAEQLSQNPPHLARSLLRQLCSARETVAPSVAEFYQRTRNDVKDQTWFHDLLAVLGQVVATYTQCFIVIDAFDEADAQSQQRGLFEVMDAMRSFTRNAVKFLVTARPHVLNTTSRFHNPVTIDIMAEAQDIRLFLTKAINDHRDSEFSLDDSLRGQVLDTLCNSANGMFLLPALHIQTILDQITKADVKRTLRHLSNNLTGAFQSTIERISSLAQTRRDLAYKTLMWTSHATRPLSVSELQHAMAVRLGDNDLDIDNIPPEQALVACCCGLVVVDPESSIIRLVHRSLEEYLRDHDHGLFGEVNLLMTRTCLHYISLDPIKSLTTKNRNDFAAAIENLPFLAYAALGWGHHAYSVRASDINHQSPDFRKWKERAWDWASSCGAGISLASAFGLTQLVQLLIHKNKHHLRLDARNLYGSTPLHEAAFNGHEGVAELLLEHGANLLDTNYGSATPIYLAVTQGRLPMVRTLLKYGREQLDVPGPRGFTALHKAAEQGIEELVVTILEAGALVAAHDDHDMTALHLAARRGHLSVARLFVSHGAVVHVEDREGLCPLDYAATGGYVELVDYLLDNGGSLTHKGRERWTPLHRAARGGHTQTVTFLL
ncbi:ankyrin repeat-containing domain protein, partial [Exophiala viscosa]|uniref:ankyrin repeat-containing domain protein n=1 Tax=Exophiala viscosa TaxID=2486360 RepID=UPI0021913D61